MAVIRCILKKDRIFPKKLKKITKNRRKTIDFISLKRYTFKHQKQFNGRKDFTAMKNMKASATEYFMYYRVRFMNAYCRMKKS